MPADSISIAAKKGTSARPARRLDSLGYNSRDWAERVHGSYLALVQHSKVADGLPLSAEKRSCSGHHN
jgi:hypothetical protein